MGRILLLLLIVLAIYLVWKAFGPSTWRRNQDSSGYEGFAAGSGPAGQRPKAIKGPDDDEDFLWQLEKERFKARREAERRQNQNLQDQNPQDPKKGQHPKDTDPNTQED